jgi:hypothetical protein
MTTSIVVIASILRRSCRRLIRPMKRRWWGRLVTRLWMSSLYLVRLTERVLVWVEVEVIEPGGL